MSGPVIACCDREHVGDPGTARANADLCAAALEDARVELVPDLCAEVSAARAAGARGLVLGLCGPGPPAADLQTLARRDGLDPLGVETVDLGLLGALGPRSTLPERAAAAILGAAAAILAGTPTPPSRLRLRLEGGEVTRRGLLASGAISYRPIAAIAPERCLGTDRCGACVHACPVGAILASRPVPAVSSDACVGCAACVAACPVGATGVGGAATEQLEARMDAVWAFPWRERPAVLFACRGAARAAARAPAEAGPSAGKRADSPAPTTGRVVGSPTPGWAVIPVPCLAAVTEGWLLEALAAGAPAAGTLGCGERCGAGSRPLVEARTAYARAVAGTERVRSARADAPEPLAPLLGPMPAPRSSAGLPPVVNEPQATAAALRALAEDDLEVAGGPLGLPAVDADGCTLCGTCTTLCPTAALRMEGAAEAPALTLDAGRCIACGHCVEVCPERVVTLERRTAPQTLAGRRTLKRAEVGRCRRCGAPVAPEPMLARIRELLPEGPAPLLEILMGLCLDCRGR